MVQIKHELDTVQQVKEEIEELREYVDRLEEHTHRRKLRLLEQVSTHSHSHSQTIYFFLFFNAFIFILFLSFSVLRSFNRKKCAGIFEPKKKHEEEKLCFGSF